jgi:hypothetical protein
MICGDRAEPTAPARNRSAKIRRVKGRLQHTNSFGGHSVELKADALGLESLPQLGQCTRIWYGELQLISRNRFL